MKTPREVLLDVECWIDYPPHVIGGATADKVLEDFAAEGYVIIPAAEVTDLKAALWSIVAHDEIDIVHDIARTVLAKAQEKK